MSQAKRFVVVVAAGVLWLLLFLVRGVSADIIDPSSPYVPHQPSVLTARPATPAPVSGVPLSAVADPAVATSPAPAASPDVSATREPEAAAAPSGELSAPTASPVAVARAAPAGAPELQRAPARVRTSRAADGNAQTIATDAAPVDRQPFEPVVEAVRSVAHSVGVFFAEVASTCKVGAAGGSGGPVLVFAVLGMVAALEWRRVLRARMATEERMPELLFAWDVIAPG